FATQPAHAQSTLSQNQDGFNGETMDGFMNMDPDKDSTVIERTVSQDYYQWRINTNTGLPDLVEPDTLHHSFHNVHLTEGMMGTYSHLGNMGSPRLSRLWFEREQPDDFIFDAPYDFWIKDASDFRFTDAKTPQLKIDYYKGGNK
ncbi:putative porin, partial [Vibrio sp. FNV 38]|nr:putative porin [Vibrio sp. FNV 38]